MYICLVLPPYYKEILGFLFWQHTCNFHFKLFYNICLWQTWISTWYQPFLRVEHLTRNVEVSGTIPYPIINLFWRALAFFFLFLLKIKTLFISFLPVNQHKSNQIKPLLWHIKPFCIYVCKENLQKTKSYK